MNKQIHFFLCRHRAGGRINITWRPYQRELARLFERMLTNEQDSEHAAILRRADRYAAGEDADPLSLISRVGTDRQMKE